MNICNLRRTFELIPQRKWTTIYVMVDLHGTIIPGSWSRRNTFTFISRDCIDVLRWFSNRKNFKLILWTSSYPDEIAEVLDWLSGFGIEFDFVNANPDCTNTQYADFRNKPYFNILIDDKAGFDAESDWAALKRELIDLGEWEKIPQ